MAKMKNSKRDAELVRKEQAKLVQDALDLGISSRKEVAGHAGIKLSELAKIFKEYKDLYALFCEIRRTIVDLASDNLFDVVADKEHPKNVDVSKWLLTNYKSDLDASLESKDDDSVEIQVGGDKKRQPTLIKFKKTGKGKE